MSAMKRRRVMLIAASVTAAAAATLIITGLPGAADLAVATTIGADTAITTTTGDYFTVALDSTKPNYGSYTVAITGTGLISSTNPSTVKVNNAHDVQLRYDGTATLDPAATLDPVFGAGFTPSGQNQPAAVRIDGHVDPAHHTASIELWVNGVHHHLGQDASHSPADPTLTRITTDLTGGNWADLYEVTVPTVRADISAANFAQRTAAGLPGTITSATTGPVTYTTVATGLTWASTPLTLTVTKDGTTTTLHATVKLVYATGSWMLYTMTMS
jgi:hypothetical protein